MKRKGIIKYIKNMMGLGNVNITTINDCLADLTNQCAGFDVEKGNKIKKTMKTDYIQGNKYYTLPQTEEFNLNLEVEVFNQKKKTWEKVNYGIALYLPRHKRKTDKIIKVNVK